MEIHHDIMEISWTRPDADLRKSAEISEHDIMHDIMLRILTLGAVPARATSEHDIMMKKKVQYSTIFLIKRINS